MGRPSSYAVPNLFCPLPHRAITDKHMRTKVYAGHLDADRLQSQLPTNNTGWQFACKFRLLNLRKLYRLEVSTEQTKNSKIILDEVFKEINIKIICQGTNISSGQMLTVYSQACSEKFEINA